MAVKIIPGRQDVSLYLRQRPNGKLKVPVQGTELTSVPGTAPGIVKISWFSR